MLPQDMVVATLGATCGDDLRWWRVVPLDFRGSGGVGRGWELGRVRDRVEEAEDAGADIVHGADEGDAAVGDHGGEAWGGVADEEHGAADIFFCDEVGEGGFGE